MYCVKNYIVKTQPESYVIKKGERVELEGYLMGNPTLTTNKGSFVVFENFDDYFREEE